MPIGNILSLLPLISRYSSSDNNLYQILSELTKDNYDLRQSANSNLSLINSLILALATETAARIAADSTLTTNLAAEVTNRTNADTTLTTNLNTEITAREALEPVVGSWTPAVTFGGGSTGITYNFQTGIYFKLKRFVWVTLIMGLSSKGSSTGGAKITGFPFTVENNISLPQLHGSFYSQLISSTAFGGYFIANTTTAQLTIPSATSSVDMDNTNFNDTSGIVLSGSYRVA